LTTARAKTKRTAERSLGVCSRHGVLRPTSSKVRESVFNILRESIEDAVFADLYAGTGAVGMEAMSRGARTVFFVEADGRRAGRIEQMIEGCGCRAKAVVVKRKAGEFIRRAAVEGYAFDIVFLDPPYRSTEMETVLPLVGEGQALNEGALVVAEHLSKRGLPDEVGVLRKKKTYKYGDTTLTLYRKA
jgi:16S rRNA (guanine966-N2)-methyltransferase